MTEKQIKSICNNNTNKNSMNDNNNLSSQSVPSSTPDIVASQDHNIKTSDIEKNIKDVNSTVNDGGLPMKPSRRRKRKVKEEKCETAVLVNNDNVFENVEGNEGKAGKSSDSKHVNQLSENTGGIVVESNSSLCQKLVDGTSIKYADIFDNNIRTYYIIRKKKMIGSNTFTMYTMDNKIMFHSGIAETQFGNSYVINRSLPIDRFSKSFTGFIRVVNRGTKYAYMVKSDEKNLPTFAESMGISFKFSESGERSAMILFAPFDSNMYMPECVENSLPSLLDKALIPENFYAFRTCKVYDATVSSIKNYDVHAIDDSGVFLRIRKEADNRFSLEARDPFTPGRAFAFAISVFISSSKKSYIPFL